MRVAPENQTYYDEMIANRKLYDALYEKRLRHAVSDEKFRKEERRLEHRGTELRELLGIGAKAVSGAYCKMCRKFYTIEYNREGFVHCAEHRYRRRCFAIERVLKED